MAAIAMISLLSLIFLLWLNDDDTYYRLQDHVFTTAQWICGIIIIIIIIIKSLFSEGTGIYKNVQNQ